MDRIKLYKGHCLVLCNIFEPAFNFFVCSFDCCCLCLELFCWVFPLCMIQSSLCKFVYELSEVYLYCPVTCCFGLWFLWVSFLHHIQCVVASLNTDPSFNIFAYFHKLIERIVLCLATYTMSTECKTRSCNIIINIWIAPKWYELLHRTFARTSYRCPVLTTHCLPVCFCYFTIFPINVVLNKTLCIRFNVLLRSDTFLVEVSWTFSSVVVAVAIVAANFFYSKYVSSIR